MRISSRRLFGRIALLACAFLLIQGLPPADVSAQDPAITAMTPDGAVSWTNTSTNCVAAIETLSPTTSGAWRTVYAELPTALVSQAQMIVTNEHALFRAINADNRAAPTNMVLIPGGTNSGTNPLASGEAYSFCWYPATYSLTVGAFYMDRYEVTKALWDDVKNWNGGNGYTYDSVGSGKAVDHPVHTVNWYDCVKWCNARSQKDGRGPVYYTDAGLSQVYKTGVLEPYIDDRADGYRLPTDDEWEYAARGGAASKRFPWGGDTISHSQANYFASTSYSYDLSSGGFHPLYTSGGYPYTSPVGTFAANGYGLYDMVGSVLEWCYDWHPCASGSFRVIRGGGWGSNAYDCRVAFRTNGDPGFSGALMGFRAVLPLAQ